MGKLNVLAFLFSLQINKYYSYYLYTLQQSVLYFYYYTFLNISRDLFLNRSACYFLLASESVWFSNHGVGNQIKLR